MKKITTRNFGTVEIAEDKIINFSRGFFGFEDKKQFFFMETRNNENFLWLQSVDDGNLCFLMIEPVSFMFNYTLEIPDDVVEELEIKTPEEVLIYAIVVVPRDPSKISANLTGPIVINATRRKGRQIVSTNPAHKVKHYIIEEMKKNAEIYLSSEESGDIKTSSDPESKEVVNASTDKKI